VSIILGRPIHKVIVIILTLLGIILSINSVFSLNLFGVLIYENSYLYYLLALFFPVVFLLHPAKKNLQKEVGVLPWYDVLLSLASTSGFVYLAWHGWDIFYKGWSFTAPLLPTIVSIVLWVIILEAVRRAGGLILAIICFIFSLYPLFAPYMPGILEGIGLSFTTTAVYHLMSVSGVIGIPMKVFGTMFIGFLVFGVALVHTGGGKFFIDIASSLLGQTRGGLAKVSILSSALFGTMSGSVVSNVLSTGSITIPAMKKAGYEPHYAGAVEACASTGGVLMPPVMGATAFLMASFLGIPYFHICLAAAIPSVLYYLSLFSQVDAHAAKKGLKGMDRSEIPPLKQVLKGGWPYILALGVLLYFLFMRMEAQAPFYSTLLLIFLTSFRKETRLTYEKSIEFIADVGKVLAELVAILAAIGFILSAMSVTGVGNSLAREIVYLAGGTLPLLLLLGALTSLILGTGMTITACYVFLVVSLAPALIKVGISPLAAHLFILYWGMISYITPPVAVGAYAAGGVAGASPMKTGFRAMLLGIAIYFLPFFFVLNPALILDAPLFEILQSFFTCAIGLVLIGAAVEGFLQGVGEIKIGIRPFIGISGVLLGIPELTTDIIGVCLGALVVGGPYLIRLIRRRRL